MLSPLSLASIVTLSGSHVFPGEIVAMSGLGSAPCSSHDGGWPLGPHPRRVARYRLDVRTGAGALLIRSKPFSVLKARPPELKQGLKARTKGASVL